ncbi:MAG: RraA family protein [Streptosporangiaceae bacterium]
MSKAAALLARLAVLDSCACSDAMDQLGLAGVAPGLRALTVTRRVTGPVITVALGPIGATGTEGRHLGTEGRNLGAAGRHLGTAGRNLGAAGRHLGTAGRHLGTAAIEAAEPGDVIVVAAGGRVDAAGWGGVLSLAAMVRGVRGVIVDGACRDVDESATLGLPVYALAAVPATARGRQAEVGWNTPVDVAGVRVSPGDLVVADGSGVVFVPAGRAGDVVAAAERIAAREAAMAGRLRAGEPASAVLSADYEDMLSGERTARDHPGSSR